MNSPRPLREQLKSLEHLQEIDLKIDSLKKNRQSLPSQLKTLDDQVLKLQTQVDLKKKSLDELEKNIRQGSAAGDLSRDRMARSQAKLEQVQNTQEFQAVTKEIEQLKKSLANLEEQAKRGATEIENSKKDLVALEAQLATLKESRETKAQQLNTEGAKLSNDTESLTQDRKQHTVHIEARLLMQYDRVRVARAGVGIVPAADGRCKGCNMVVPPQLYIQIQKGLEVHSCPSCHRILFVPGSVTG